MTSRFADNPYYTLYESQLIDLHRLAAEGKGDSDGADSLRDAMEFPERELSDEELSRLNGLSADLYMLSGREQYEPSDSETVTPDQLRARIQAAWQSEEWDTVLRLFRRGEAGFSQDQIAYLRARAYEKLHHLHPASLFMRQASILNPSSVAYQSMSLELLLRLGQHQEAFTVAEQTLNDPNAPLFLRILAAEILVNVAQERDLEVARPIHEQVVRELREILRSPAFLELPTAGQVLGFLDLAASLEKLGQFAEAIAAMTEALTVQPNNDRVLVARGLLRAREDPTEAVTDFQLAVEQGTLSVTPYLFLAQHFLVHRNFREALRLAERGVPLSRNPRIVAQLRQSIAIAGFALGVPETEVLREFQVALELDPLNEGIQRNFQHFRNLKAVNPIPSRQEIVWPEYGYLDLTQARKELGVMPSLAA